MMRRTGAGIRLALASTVLLVSLSQAAAGVASATAPSGWTITVAPKALMEGVAKHVIVTLKDTSTLLTGGGKIGCMAILALPARTVVGAISMVSAPSGKHWSGQVSGGRMEFVANAGSDILDGSLLGLGGAETVVFDVVVTGTSPGSADWTAQAWRDRNCAAQDAGVQGSPQTFAVAAAPSPTPTPAPTAPLTPAPTAPPTPAPTASPTSAPTVAPTVAPTAAPTANPTATPPGVTPGPTSTPAPSQTTSPTNAPSPDPAASSSTGPSASPSASPSIDPAASPTPTPSASSSLLPGGAGSGLTIPGGPAPSDGAGAGAIAIGDKGFDVRLDAQTTADDIAGDFGGVSMILDWAVPTALMTVPGLLLLVILAQLGGGMIWLPVARRTLGGFGLRKRRRSRAV